MSSLDLSNLTYLAVKASVKAGETILKHYKNTYSIEYKSDSSPLTSADSASHTIIQNLLSATKIPVLSEEGKDIPFDIRKSWKLFWLIDPLDGTKEFINGNDEFTVNVALIKDGTPLLGVVYVPVTGVLYFGNSLSGSYKLQLIANNSKFTVNNYNTLITRSEVLPRISNNKITVIGSRSHSTNQTSEIINSIVNKFGNVNIINTGSSLKFCKLAEGSADIYPRLGPTMEWDTAAGHAVCKFANIEVLNFVTKEELVYNKPDLLNPWFIAFKPDFAQFIRELKS